MKHKGRALLPPYREALLRHLKRGTAASLRPAQRLGCRAVALGLEALDLAWIHEEAFVSAVEPMPVDSPAARNALVKRAGLFFAEALLPLEATHRAAREANDRLNALNRALSRRTRDLLASNRKLAREITGRRAAQESLRRSEAQSVALLVQSRRFQEELRLLSRRILSAQEDERKRISRELHDVIAQMLTGINIRLATLQTEAATNTKGLSRNIARAQRLVERSVNRVHRFARELRPAVLDDLGLIPAVHSFLKGFTKQTGVRASLTAYAGVEALNGATRTVLYRVVQESLTNVARHAQANRVEVSIRKLARTARMRIRDDGKGFDVDGMWNANKARHLGMLGMRERVEMVGGSFAVESAPGRGATIQAQVPLRHSGKEPART